MIIYPAFPLQVKFEIIQLLFYFLKSAVNYVKQPCDLVMQLKVSTSLTTIIGRNCPIRI